MSYPSKTEQFMLDAAKKLMEETMARYDPSHDKYHVERVRHTALVIARHLSKTQKVDLLVVELAAILHDVLDKKYVTAEQAADPYAFFLPLFQSLAATLGWNDPNAPNLVADGRGRIIARIVDNVSWTTEKKRRTNGEWGEWHDSCVELHCVQDADRLDAIGAFGVLRCAAYTSTVNHPLYAPPDDPAQEQSAIQHFYDKLLHIRDRLKTEPGRKLGEKRHRVLLDFLESVKEEATLEELDLIW